MTARKVVGFSPSCGKNTIHAQYDIYLDNRTFVKNLCGSGVQTHGVIYPTLDAATADLGGYICQRCEKYMKKLENQS